MDNSPNEKTAYASCCDPAPSPAMADDAMMVGMFFADIAITDATMPITQPTMTNQRLPKMSERPPARGSETEVVIVLALIIQL